MPACAVLSCTTNQSNFKSLKLMMHRFPISDVKLCKIWKAKCRNRNIGNVKSSVVCSKHFSEDAYERDLQSELLGLPVKKRLLKDAVPTLFLKSSEQEGRGDCLRALRLAKRNARMRALSRIAKSRSGDGNGNTNVPVKETNSAPDGKMDSVPEDEIDPETAVALCHGEMVSTAAVLVTPEVRRQVDSFPVTNQAVGSPNPKVTVPSCAVRGCNTNRLNCASLGLVLHKFPMRNERLCKIWKSKCRDPQLLVMTKTAICSKHFSADCYERDLRSELLHLPPKKVLLKNSIPTLFLPMVLNKENLQDRTLLHIGNSITIPSATATRQCDESVTEPDKNAESVPEVEVQSPLLVHVIVTANDGTVSDRDTDDLMLRNKDLQGQVQRLQNTVSELKKNLDGTKELSRKLKRAHTQLGKARVKSEEWKKRYQAELKSESKVMYLKEVLRPRFTDGQINCMINGIDRPKQWENEDIVEALTLRNISEKAYRHIRAKKIPYPGLSTITNWIEKFDCSPGTLTNALLFLKCQSFSETDRQCVLVFGEVGVDCRACYDSRYDVVIGPHTTSLIIMLRGIFRDWQQPIYYNFDKVMTKELLEQLITDVEKIDYQVVGCVSDLSAKNRCLWWELNITAEKPCFANPCDEKRNVWVFANIPRLIVMLRNHFLECGFRLPSGKTMTKRDIQMLMETDSPEVKTTHRLTVSHLDIAAGNDGERVELARQLFSYSVAQALEDVLNFTEESEAFQLISDFFNVCNSSVRNDRKKSLSTTCGFTLDERAQVLDEMKRFVANLNFNPDGGTLLAFQTDILVSIASVQGLFHDLKALACGNSYLNTQRLNVECLENLVDKIRSLGKYRENLLPSEFETRLLLVMLGVRSDSEVASETSEESDSCGEERIVTAAMLSEASLRIRSEDVLREVEDDREILDGQEVAYLLVEVNDKEDVSVQHLSTDEAGLKYIAGYVAVQCRDMDASLACDCDGTPFEIPKWLPSTLSIQTEPSEEWFQMVKEFELFFNEIHSTGVSKERGILKKLQTLLEDRYPHVNKDVIKTYSRTRTLMRLKYLNNSKGV